MRVTCCQILAPWSVRQRWEYIHHCDVCWNRIWSFWCFVLVWLLAYVSDFCFQTYFKNADGPWKAAINAVRQRNQANSTVPQPLLLGTAQPHSRKRVGFAPQEAAKQLFSWWVMANSGSWVIFQSSEGWDSYMGMQHARYNGSLDAFFFLHNRIFVNSGHKCTADSLLFVCFFSTEMEYPVDCTCKQCQRTEFSSGWENEPCWFMQC